MMLWTALYVTELYMVVSDVSRWYRYTVSSVSIRFMNFLPRS